MAVDGDSLAHRAYHGLPKTISRAGGRPPGARRLRELPHAPVGHRAAARGRRRLGHARVAHVPARRARVSGGKGLRRRAARAARHAARAGGSVRLRAARAAGYEADDFLGAAAAAEEKRRGTCVVVTSDRDAYQLASARTTILKPVRGVFELDRIGPAQVLEIYGVEPEQVPDFIALRGDPSDKIPGAKGVGPTAATVLLEHGTLEAALAAGRFPIRRRTYSSTGEGNTFDASAPPSLSDQTPTWAEASSRPRVGMKALSERLAERAE